MGKRVLEGDALMKRAQELGVCVDSDYMVTTPGQGTNATPAPEYEIQRRVLEAERHIREHKLWLIALISAIASVISAVAAWVGALAR